MHIAFAAVSLALNIFAAGRSTPDFDGKVLGVLDGRTIVVAPNRELHGPSRRITVRLYGIIVPATPHHVAKRATRYLKSLALGRKVDGTIVDGVRTSMTGRVWMGKKQLNSEMVRQGLATVATQAGKDYPELIKALQEARAARRGIWRQPPTK